MARHPVRAQRTPPVRALASFVRGVFGVARPPLLAGVVGAGLAAPTAAHQLQYQVEAGKALSVALSAPQDGQLVDVPYELYPPGGDTPFQAGRSDARGRVTFRPDQAGTWRLEVMAEDGHGLTAEIDVASVAKAEATGSAGVNRWAATGAGIGYLAGIAGLLLGWQQWRARKRQGRGP